MLFCFLHTLFVEEVPLFIEDDHHESFLLTSPFSFYVFAFPKLEHGAGLKTLDSISVYDLEIILRGLKKFFFWNTEKTVFCCVILSYLEYMINATLWNKPPFAALP